MARQGVASIALTTSLVAASACSTSAIETPVSGSLGLDGFKLEVVATGLDTPWSIAFVPDGRMFVAERKGTIRVVKNGTLQDEPLAIVQDAVETGEGGLMGMVLHPDFEENHWIYVAFTHRQGNGYGVRVERYRESATGLGDKTVIIDGIEGGRVHDGTELGFGPDGKLYITTGEVGRKQLAQVMSSLNGKTLRLNDDGSVPDDNPFVGKPGVRPEIWTYGHRNAQGMDWQPGTGLMFQAEHGPSGFDAPGGGDEVNIVERGKDYGWPTIHHIMTREGMESPLLEYTPAIAPSGAAFSRGDRVPEIKNDLFVACLRGRGLLRVQLDGRTVTGTERLFQDLGRCREVISGPDGYLYFTTSNNDGRGRPAPDDDRIFRIVPD